MIHELDLSFINQIYVSISSVITELWSISIFQVYLYGIYQSGMIVIYDLHPWSVRDLKRMSAYDTEVNSGHCSY